MELSLQDVRDGARALVAVAVVIAAIKHRAVYRAVRTFFFEPGSAVGLALMRLTIFGMLLRRASPDSLVSFTNTPAVLRRLPYGWDRFEPFLPFDEPTVRVIGTAFAITCALTVLGLFTRVAAPIAAVLGVYVLGVPNFYGKIDHGWHCIALSALILSVSPCGDALSLDRLWRRYRGQAPPPLSATYTLPLRFCFLILGTVYLFPGFYKLWKAGDLWITGVQLPAMLRSQWARVPDFVPVWRADEHPLLMQVLGTSTLLLEIGFIFLLFNRWTRVFVAFSAVAFHVSIALLMGIRFHYLLPLVLLYDLPGLPNALAARFPRLTRPLVERASALRARIEALLSGWFGPAGAPQVRGRFSGVAALLVGATLFYGQMYAGIKPFDSWPLAVHPRFDRRLHRSPNTRQRIAVVIDRASGEPSVDMDQALVNMGRIRSIKVVQRLHDLYRKPSDDPKRIAAEQAVMDLMAKNGVALEAGDRISLLRERWDMFPLDRRDGIRRQVMRRWEVMPNGRLGPQSERWTKKKKKKKKSST